jgi:peroxiredoxin
MSETKTNVLVVMLIGIVILLMLAIVGLFIRMNQLQSVVLAAMEPYQDVTQESSGLEVETPAPTFTLKNTEGEMISLEDYSGQKVLLVFSSTKCPFCLESYPKLKTFSEQHKEMQVVMISMGTEEENRALASEQGFTFPILAWENTVATDYLIPGTPFLYVIDERSMVADRGPASLLEELE